MVVEPMIASNTFTENFLRLPRELRDLIYAEVYGNLAPIRLEDVPEDPVGVALFATNKHTADPGCLVEFFEAFYTYSTFSVTFSHSCEITDTSPIGWSRHPQYERYIQKLIVHAEEEELGATISLEVLEQKCLDGPHPARLQWEDLLQLPRLTDLTIQLQKRKNRHFSWADFSPILFQLRETLPKLRLVFKMSFDTLLERYWSDPIWENFTEPGNVIEEPYIPMGFVDVTELIESPTGEDFACVKNLGKGRVETWGQDILRGLLDETPSERRVLALHYVVAEPALLRVRMMEHFEVYKRMKGSGVGHVE